MAPNIQIKRATELPENHLDRLDHILDQSWLILKSRFVHGRHPILLEAPFQHYFAQILSNYGELCCTGRDDLFLVDLEAKQASVAGKTKYLDITCSFPGKNVSCALELKFKTKRQAAVDFGRIDAYVDLAALESACAGPHGFGRFYMITDSTGYVRASKVGVGTVFALHHGHRYVANTPLQAACVGREHVNVTLSNSYEFRWEQIGTWYFLEVRVPPMRGQLQPTPTS